MDSIFVRKFHRRKGLGLKMLEDFVLSFSEDCLGLRYPLTHVMFKVCEKYLSRYPGDKALLWEVEGAGEHTQRSSIASRIHSRMETAVSRSLLTELNDAQRPSEAGAVRCSFELTEERTTVKTGKGQATLTTVSVSTKKVGDEVTEETSEKVIRIERIEAESSDEHVCVQQRETTSIASSGDEEDDQAEEDAALSLQPDAELKGTELAHACGTEEDAQDTVMVVISEEVHDESEATRPESRTTDLVSEEESAPRVTEGSSQEATLEGSLEADAAPPFSDELQATSDEVDGEGEEPPARVRWSRSRKSQRRKRQKPIHDSKLDEVHPEADSTCCGKQVASSEEHRLPDLQRVSVVLVDLRIQQDVGQGTVESAVLESNLRDPCSHPPEAVPQQEDGEDRSKDQEESAATHSGRVKRAEEQAEDREEDEVMESSRMGDVAQERVGEEHAEEPAEDQGTEPDTAEGGTVSTVNEGTCLSGEAEELLSQDVGEPLVMEADSLTAYEDEVHQCMGRTVSVVLVDLNPQQSNQGLTQEMWEEGAPSSSAEEGADKLQSMEKVSLILDEANVVTRRLRSSGRVTTEAAEEDGEVQERVLRKDRRYNLRTPKRRSYRARRQCQTEHQRSDRDQPVGETCEGTASLQAEDGEAQHVDTETVENTATPAQDTSEAQVEETAVENSGKHQSREESSQPSDLHSDCAASIQQDEDDGGQTSDTTAEINTAAPGSDSNQPSRQIHAEEVVDTTTTTTQEMVEKTENEDPVSVACEDTSAEEEVGIVDQCSDELQVKVTGSEPLDPDERGDDETPNTVVSREGRAVEAAPGSVATGEEPAEELPTEDPGDESEPAVVMEIDIIVADSTSAQLEEGDLDGGKVGSSEESEDSATKETSIDEGEHQLHHEVCDAAPLQERSPEDQSDEGSLADAEGQQVNDKVAEEEATEEPEEAPITATRVLRSGKKIKRAAAASQSDDGSAPRRASRRARRHTDIDSEDEEGQAEEKIPADTSLHMVLEEDKNYEECDVNQEEELEEPAVKENEVQELAASTNEEKDTTLFEQPEEPQTGDEELPQVESADVLSAEKSEDIAVEETEDNAEHCVEPNSAEPEEDATEQPGRDSDESDPTAQAAAQELLDAEAGLEQVESQQMTETLPEEEVSPETGNLSGDGVVISTAKLSGSEEEPSPEGSSNEPEPTIHQKVSGRKRKSRHVTPRRKSSRAKRRHRSDEEETEEMAEDVDVPQEALVDQGNIEEEQAQEDVEHREQGTSELPETEAAPEQMEEMAEDTGETDEGLEPDMEHQLLQEKSPENQGDEGSQKAEEQAPATVAGADAEGQQVDETVDDKVAEDEATETSEKPEETPITATRVLRSGKKIKRAAAASQSDDGSAPRRASRRARRHTDIDSEDEEGQAEEKIPADTSLHMVQEEDKHYEECDVNQEEELEEPAVKENEVQELAASTNEEKDTTLFEQPEEPQTGDEELPQVESADVLSAEKSEDIAVEETEDNAEHCVEPEEDATERPGRESDESDPTAQAAAQELLDAEAGLEQVESQQMTETLPEEEVSPETGNLSGDRVVISTAKLSGSEEEPSAEGSSNEPEPTIHQKVSGRKRKSRRVTPRRKSSRAKRRHRSDEEETEEMAEDVDVPQEALVDQGNIEEEQAQEDVEHREQGTSELPETEAAPEQMEEMAEDTGETDEGLEPDMEHQLLQEKSPENQGDEGSQKAEEQAPATVAGADAEGQQVDETVDDKVAEDEATETSEKPEETPITATRVLRSGKKIKRAAAASQSDDGSAPRRASRRARRHTDIDSEDEEGQAEEKIPADTSLHMVQEEDKHYEECDVNQEEELEEPAVKENEVQELAASTNEEKDTTLFEQPEEPQTGDEELPQVESADVLSAEKSEDIAVEETEDNAEHCVEPEEDATERPGRESDESDPTAQAAAQELLDAEAGLEQVESQQMTETLPEEEVSPETGNLSGDGVVISTAKLSGSEEEPSPEGSSNEPEPTIHQKVSGRKRKSRRVTPRRKSSRAKRRHRSDEEETEEMAEDVDVPQEALVDQGNIEEEQAQEDVEHREQGTSELPETEAAPKQMEEMAEDTGETDEGLEPDMEHQLLQEKSPENQGDEGSQKAEEQAPATVAGADAEGQQVDETVDDKVAEDEATETSEKPEETPITATRVLRSGKKIKRAAAASQSDDGSAPRRASRRARRHSDIDSEDEEAQAEEKIPADTSLHMVQEEDKNYEECDVNQEEEPVVEENEVQELAASTSEEDTREQKTTEVQETEAAPEEMEEMAEDTGETEEGLEPDLERLEDHLVEQSSEILEQKSPEKVEDIEPVHGSEKTDGDGSVSEDHSSSESEVEELLVISERSLRGRVIPSVVLSPSHKFRAEPEETSADHRSVRRSPRKRKSSVSAPVRRKRPSRVEH
ncbi:nestin-like isoform X2 [Synchiropus splendidus]|nr:nestin-like isoform X2 [Synchiropus splendidus]